jgi:Flp pilus assembly secretin CpaC
VKSLILIPFSLAAALACAETTSQSQVRHVQTSLNHLTVLEFGEPVTTLAVADPDSFKIEHHDDKVFVMPLREKVSTNLFVWTASRQLSYELDPAGPLVAMDVLIRTEPPASVHSVSGSSAPHTEGDTRKISSQVLAQTMMGVQYVLHDPAKSTSGHVQVEIEQVYRSKDQIYIRYSVSNQTSVPFRLTTPDVSNPLITQEPISLTSLRNHQLSAQTFAAYKSKPGSSLPVVQAQTVTNDLAPGQKTTGMVSVSSSEGNPPELYQLNFGADNGQPITVEAVL